MAKIIKCISRNLRVLRVKEFTVQVLKHLELKTKIIPAVIPLQYQSKIILQKDSIHLETLINCFEEVPCADHFQREIKKQ